MKRKTEYAHEDELRRFRLSLHPVGHKFCLFVVFCLVNALVRRDIHTQFDAAQVYLESLCYLPSEGVDVIVIHSFSVFLVLVRIKEAEGAGLFVYEWMSLTSKVKREGKIGC